MRQLPSLPRLAIAVWLSWLGLLGLMFGMQAWQVWNPHFLPMTALLVVLVVSGLSLVGGATWRLLRGPDRGRALTCWLLGTPPLWFMAGHAMLGLEAAYGRNIRLDLALKMLVPLGGSLMDLEARIRYPQWTAGEKVVMVSTRFAGARSQVAAMDQHVRQLEARLGRMTAWRVHWVRGPLLGMDGHAMFSLCVGTRPGREPVDSEELDRVDRHEVAHCVIESSLNTPASEPPALLVEGWAQANQGTDPAELAARAWERRTQGDNLSLRELTGPGWYDRHEWPVYAQGAPLVNFILERFGPERFLTLYTKCGRSTFDADCRRILGVSLDELDAAYWADIERQVGREGTLAGRLRHLKLGPAVDAAAWQAFLNEYLPEVERLLGPYENVRLSSEFRHSSTDPRGKTTDFEQHIEFQRSGPFRSLRIRSRYGEDVYLAHPGRSLKASRESPGVPWEVREYPTMSPERSYRRMLASIDRSESLTNLAAALLDLAEELQNRVDISGIVVVKLEPLTEDGRRFVRVRLEDQTTSAGGPWRSFTVVLSAGDHFAVRSDEIELSNGTKLRGEFAYDVHDGLPVVRSLRNSSTAPDGTRTTGGFTVVDRRFEPTPEAEFTPERLLAGSPVRTIAEPDPYASEPTMFARWYWVPLVAGVLCLAGGVAARLWSPSRPRLKVDSVEGAC